MGRHVCFCALAFALGILASCNSADVPEGFTFCWGDSGRHYRADVKPQDDACCAFGFPAWKGERVNAMALVWSDVPLADVKVSAGALRNGRHRISADGLKVRFVSYVMSDVLDSTRFGQCGYRKKADYDSLLVADVIDIDLSRDIPAKTVQPVWLSVDVPCDAEPGEYSGELVLKGSGMGRQVLPVSITVLPRVLPEPSEWDFHLDIWQNPYSVARYEGVELWSDAHFEAMRPVMKILAEAGQKVVTATIMDRPWNGQTEDAFGSMVVKTRKADGTWDYDFSAFDRWVEFMAELGIDSQINCYSMIPWNMKFDYVDAASGQTRYVEAGLDSKEYRWYWESFISAFAGHLREKGWFGKTMIAMDERPLDAMLTLIDIVKGVEPDFKLSLAGNWHPEIETHIDDYCLAYGQAFPDGVAGQRRERGQFSTVYTCCSEARPNMFLVSEPSEASWLPWHALSGGYDGYLRWAYNSWTVDPLSDARFRAWPAGDCFVVYPGGRSSVRMEKLAEGIRDYEKAVILMDEWRQCGDTVSLGNMAAVLEEFKAFALEEGCAGDAVKKARALVCR